MKKCLLPLLFLSSFTACSGAEPGAGEAADQGAAVGRRPDESRFDVKWKPDTIVVDEGVARRAWLTDRSAPSDGKYVFEDVAELASLREGATVLFPGIGLLEITSLERTGGRVEIATEPGSLLDAASEGELSWSVDVTAHDDAIALTPQADPAKKPGVATQTLSPLGGPITTAQELSYEAEGGPYTIGVKMSRADVGSRSALAFEITGKYEEEAHGVQLLARTELKGTVSFRSQGLFRFREGEVLAFDFDARDVDLDATGFVEMKSLTIRGELVDYPARMIVPFMVGPMPMYYAFGAAVDLSGTIGNGQSAKLTGTFRYKGDIGFEGKGARISNVKATGKPELTGTVDPHVRAEATVISTLAAPRIELGMGVPQLGKRGVSAGVFIDMRASLAASVEVTSSQDPCLEALGALGAYYGGEAKMFGLELGTEKPLVKFHETTAKRGSCAE